MAQGGGAERVADQELAGGPAGEGGSELGEVLLGGDGEGFVTEEGIARGEGWSGTVLPEKRNVDGAADLEVAGEERALEGRVGFADGEDERDMGEREGVGEEEKAEGVPDPAWLVPRVHAGVNCGGGGKVNTFSGAGAIRRVERRGNAG